MTALKNLILNLSGLDEPIGSQLRDHYYRLRYTVFAGELAWNIPRVYSQPDDITKDNGIYSILYDADSKEPVGAVRGAPVSLEFPHSQLFSHHESSDLFIRAIQQCCTINGLAVECSYRGSRFMVLPHKLHGSAGSLLMISILSFFEAQGLSGCLLTAGNEKARRFFEKLGFHAIDPAVVTYLHALPLVNMGLSFSSARYIKALLDAGMWVQRQSDHYKNITDTDLFIQSRITMLQRNDGRPSS